MDRQFLGEWLGKIFCSEFQNDKLVCKFKPIVIPVEFNEDYETIYLGSYRISKDISVDDAVYQCTRVVADALVDNYKQIVEDLEKSGSIMAWPYNCKFNYLKHVSYYLKTGFERNEDDEEYGITSGCHGTSKKPKSKKKKPVKSSFDEAFELGYNAYFKDVDPYDANPYMYESDEWFEWERGYEVASKEEELGLDGLYSSKKSKKQSFHVFSSVLVKNSAIESKILKPGTFGIEADVNGWKIVNTEGKPAGGEPVEFDSEGDAKNSTIFKNLVERYGADKVRVYKQ